MSKLIRFGLKAGIISSAVYITIDKGVWKDSEITSQLYQDLKTTIKPYVKPVLEQIPFQFPELPKAGDLVSTAKTTWNKGVISSCLFLAELPDLTWDLTKKGTVYTYNKIMEELKSINDVKNEKENQNTNLAN
ncbi:conserved hypothetical protein [Pediculus humanus corporis]|uniref:MICOS complex subunit MIC13 n=1 Tax=Pediculus humanus subsp. corporis TaxID=121224 RepID=E0VB41_PEDHC|nr:uncharacterized protein Phum_PHUM050950 [Pediculus humanus corporis]EEB10597.1 conserved hypothetical protein [Pediculus humanus corporis]